MSWLYVSSASDAMLGTDAQSRLLKDFLKNFLNESKHGNGFELAFALGLGSAFGALAPY